MDDQQGPEKLVVILDCRGASAFQVISPLQLVFCNKMHLKSFKTQQSCRSLCMYPLLATAAYALSSANPLDGQQLAMNSSTLLLMLYAPDVANQAVTNMWA